MTCLLDMEQLPNEDGDGSPASLRILHWNARSLRAKTSDLRNLLQKEKVHIALIQEAYLPPTSNWIGEYGEVTDPHTGCRNTVTLIHNSLRYSVITPSRRPRGELADTVTVSIPSSCGPIYITNTYIHPQGSYTPTEVWDEVFGPLAILAGDFHAHNHQWDRLSPEDRRGTDICAGPQNPHLAKLTASPP